MVKMSCESRRFPRSKRFRRNFWSRFSTILKSLGAVESRRGMRGGYRLARPPEHITLASIVRHVEGAMAPVSCVSERFYERCTCPDEARCPFAT